MNFKNDDEFLMFSLFRQHHFFLFLSVMVICVKYTMEHGSNVLTFKANVTKIHVISISIKFLY